MARALDERRRRPSAADVTHRSVAPAGNPKNTATILGTRVGLLPGAQSFAVVQSEGPSLVGADRTPFGPDGVESVPKLLLEQSDRLVELDSVVGVGNRVGVLEDAVRTGEEAAGTLELAVVERKDSRVEEALSRPCARILRLAREQ